MLKKNRIWLTVIILSALPLVYSSISVLGSLLGSVPEDVTTGLINTGESLPLWERLHQQTGQWAIQMIVITLSCTPISILSGSNRILRYKKVFGIYVFIYTILHLSFYMAHYSFFEIFREMDLIVALIAAVIIIPLGLTSNKLSKRLLKQNWKKFHEFAYAAAIAAVLHVALLGKGLWLTYAVILSIGFILRIPAVEYFFRKGRTNYSIGPTL